MAATELELFARAISRVLGWLYFLCWSLSFYPQPMLNWRRRSTLGLTIDFPFLNVLGFIAYTVSTGAMMYSSTIRSQYAYRHPASPEPTVRFNDFLFAAHGALLCVITYSQFWLKSWGFKVGARQKASTMALIVFWFCIALIVVTIFIIETQGRDGGYDPKGWAWIDVIYTTGYVKLIVTVIKYMPQVWVNYKRKSTVGWSIGQILLDFAGGVMSIMQLVIDASLQADWSGLIGNPVKFGLGNVSIIFDLIFIVQHYLLYKHGVREELGEEERLRDEESRALLTED